MEHAIRQIDQTKRRVIDGKVIPHDEKVFLSLSRTPNGSAKAKRVFPWNWGSRYAFWKTSPNSFCTIS